MADNVVSRVSSASYLQSVTLGFTPMGMLADRLAPRIPVAHQSKKYRVFGKNGLIQRRSEWAPGTIPNAIESRWSDDTYFADIYKLRHPLLDHEVVNNDDPALGGMDLRAIYTQTTTNAIAIAREARVAAMFTTSANYPGANVITKGASSGYDTTLSSAPGTILTDMRTLGGTVADAAMVPKSQVSAVIPETVFRAVVEGNTAILDSIKYSQTGVVTADLLAKLLGIKEVLLSQSNVAGAGPETAGSDVITGYTVTNLWADTIWMGVIGTGMNDMTPSFARSFNWKAATGGQERRVRQYRMADEGQEGDWIEVAEAIDEKIVYSGAGGIIKNALDAI